MMQWLVRVISFIIVGALSLFAQVSGGDYYIPQGSNPQGYSSLAAAFADINANGVSGTVNLLIDADITEVGSNLILNRSDLTNTNNVVIKPAPGKTVIITIDGSGPLAINNTPYVTIDGSNNGSTSRDMTIYQSSGYDKVIHIFGNSDNFLLKNTILTYPSNPTASNNWVIYSDVPTGATDVPDGVRIENCVLGSSGFSNLAAVYVSGSSTASLYPSTWLFSNNTFYGRLGGYAGVGIFYCGTVGTRIEFRDNEFIADNNLNSSSPVLSLYQVEGEIYIQRNRFHTFSSNNDNGNLTLVQNTQVRDGGANVYVYNNFLGGNVSNGTVAPAYYYLLDISAPNAKYYVYHNTFRMNPLIANPITDAACIYCAGTIDVKNNIIIQDVDASNAYAIYNNGILTSDYNNFQTATNANVGYNGSTSYKTLSDWQTGTSQDGNSTNVAVTFVNISTDFHLSGSSIGDPNLAGTPIAGVTDDIDQQPRSATAPYKGADENTDNPLPVTLSSFQALPEDRAVRLIWITESEFNNLGFILERATAESGPFKELASYRTNPALNGEGNSSQPKTYEFVDRQVEHNATYWYKLYSVDMDGTIHFVQKISAAVLMEGGPLTRNNSVLPQQFALRANFPNPFNPTTYLSFDVAETSRGQVPVVLEVFDMAGRKIRTLVNAPLAPGRYTVMWDGRDANHQPVASGLYIYRLKAGAFVQSRTMQLLK